MVLNADYSRAGGWGDEYRPIFRFDVVSIGGQIERAELVLTTIADGGAPARVRIYRITSQWNPANARYWADLPDDQLASTAIYTAQPGEEIRMDVTDLVRLWLSGTPNYGLTLHPVSTNNEFLRFHSARSAEAASRPKLIITVGP